MKERFDGLFPFVKPAGEPVTLRDKLWLWGQSADCHWIPDNASCLPGHSRMTATEGAVYFGIPNMCRVRCNDLPEPPFDQESIALRPCREVIWSLLGAAGAVDEWGDLDEVIRQAQRFPNVTGGVFDDFFVSDERFAMFPPEKLREIKRRLCEGAGRPMQMWCVLYEFNLDVVKDLSAYLDVFDVVSYWTWFGSTIGTMEQNIERVRAMCPGKRILSGCYLWNYGEKKPLTAEQMAHQLDVDLRLLREKKIDGVIVCSNCNADLGIPQVETMREWIAEHGEEVLV